MGTIDLISASTDGGRRCVRRAGPAVPPGAPGALLPDARLLPGRRGCSAGLAARRLARSGRLRGARLAADLALPHRNQPLPQRCRAAGRRQAKAWDVPGVEPPEPTRLGEVPWLQPYPDALLEDVVASIPSPEARYEQTESISLAFVDSPPAPSARRLAVLVLRDVLGFHADEVAAMLDATVDSVNSAVKRARASLEAKLPPGGDRPHAPAPAPAPESPEEDAIVAKFVAAYESSDVDALVALFTDDVFVSMPPLPFEYEGREPASRLFASIFGSGRQFTLLPTRANGQPAFGAYVRDPNGIRHGAGLFVLTLAGERICAATRFESGVLPWFGLPRSLARRGVAIRSPTPRPRRGCCRCHGFPTSPRPPGRPGRVRRPPARHVGQPAQRRQHGHDRVTLGERERDDDRDQRPHHPHQLLAHPEAGEGAALRRQGDQALRHRVERRLGDRPAQTDHERQHHLGQQRAPDRDASPP